MTLVATGPLTNVALLSRPHPAAAAALERVVIMGGSIGLGNITPAAEFNIWADPDAAQRVFTSGLDVTMVGLDVTHKALFTPSRTTGCARAAASGRLTAELVDYYRPLATREGPASRSTTPWRSRRSVAAGLLTLVDRNVEVDCGPVSRGRTLVDLRR